MTIGLVQTNRDSLSRTDKNGLLRQCPEETPYGNDYCKRFDPGKQQRLNLLERQGYPACTTSVGWYGFTDDQVRKIALTICTQVVASIPPKTT